MAPFLFLHHYMDATSVAGKTAESAQGKNGKAREHLEKFREDNEITCEMVKVFCRFLVMPLMW